MKKAAFALSLIYLLHGTSSFASFDENERRYMTGEEIVWTVDQFFQFNSTDGTCNGIDSANYATPNASKLGLSSPVTGQPVSASPTQATVQWITGCVSKALNTNNIYYICNDMERLKHLIGEASLKNIFQPTAALSGNSPVYICTGALSVNWSTLTDAQKQTLVHDVVLNMLGPDSVIVDFGFIKNPDDFRKKLLDALNAKPATTTILDAIRFLAVNLSVRDEFLSY